MLTSHVRKVIWKVLETCHVEVDNICSNLTWLTWMSNCSDLKTTTLLSLSGVCRLWRLRRGVEYWGAGTSVFHHFTLKDLINAAFYFCVWPAWRWSALCPFRLSWSVGPCCRRPMTSVMRSLCVGWPGSPGRQRSVMQLLIGVYYYISVLPALLLPLCKPHQY